MTRLAVINVVGLTEALIGPHTPSIHSFARGGALSRIAPAFPALTCTAQSNYLTGALPSLHGIVGNGWYNRDLAEVHFWKQSNHLVSTPKIWDELRGRMPNFTSAVLFWWFNMYSGADYSITPRPMYPADGRKIFDIYTKPATIRLEIKRDLGDFPFATFWGPAAGLKTPQGPPDAASRWIAASAKWIEQKHQPTLSLIYLPHLDYALQRHGPFLAEGKEGKTGTGGASTAGGARAINPAVTPDLRAIDEIVGDLIRFFHERGARVVLLSEYGLTNVNRPIHLNRLFRHKGWLAVREELGLELLDPGASEAFAVADHQIAHVYLKNPSQESTVMDFIQTHTGSMVLGAREKAKAGIDHPRAGDLIAVAPEDGWFTYYYWLEDRRAPDFARTVDIHRKPGYDPVELFADPELSPLALKAWITLRLLQKRLGFRMLMDVIPLDASLVAGSHGRPPANPADYPVFISERADLLPVPQIESTDVYHALVRHALR